MTDGYDLTKEVIPHSTREVIPHLKQGGLTESIAQGEDHGANLEGTLPQTSPTSQQEK